LEGGRREMGKPVSVAAGASAREGFRMLSKALEGSRMLSKAPEESTMF
jgi:hypothetical protein